MQGKRLVLHVRDRGQLGRGNVVIDRRGDEGAQRPEEAIVPADCGLWHGWNFPARWQTLKQLCQLKGLCTAPERLMLVLYRVALQTAHKAGICLAQRPEILVDAGQAMQRLRSGGFASVDRVGEAPRRLEIAGGGVLDHPVRFRQLAIELGQPEGLHTGRAVTVEGQQRIGIAGADLQQEKVPRLEGRHAERFAFGAGDQWERMGVL